MRLGLVAILGSGLGLRWQGVGVMGHTVKLESKAQIGLGITMSYNFLRKIGNLSLLKS